MSSKFIVLCVAAIGANNTHVDVLVFSFEVVEFAHIVAAHCLLLAQ